MTITTSCPHCGEHHESPFEDCQPMVVPHYNVTVKLVGEDGNAFAILGRVNRALKKAGASGEDLERFMDQATSGDYDDLLATVQRWVYVV